MLHRRQPARLARELRERERESFRRDGVAVITLDRPEARNAFSGPMGRSLGEAYRACDGDDAVRAVVVARENLRVQQERYQAELVRADEALKEAQRARVQLEAAKTAELFTTVTQLEDADAFRRHLKACETHNHPVTEVCPDCVPLLEQAAALYRDDFLAGFTLRDSADLARAHGLLETSYEAS